MWAKSLKRKLIKVNKNINDASLWLYIMVDSLYYGRFPGISHFFKDTKFLFHCLEKQICKGFVFIVFRFSLIHNGWTCHTTWSRTHAQRINTIEMSRRQHLSIRRVIRRSKWRSWMSWRRKGQRLRVDLGFTWLISLALHYVTHALTLPWRRRTDAGLKTLNILSCKWLSVKRWAFEK